MSLECLIYKTGLSAELATPGLGGHTWAPAEGPSEEEATAGVSTIALVFCGTSTGPSLTPDSLQGPWNSNTAG